MTIVYNSALEDLARGAIDFDTDTFFAMLVTSTYVANKDTHLKRSDVTNEVTGTGYTAGGELVTGATISTDTQTGTVYVNFADVSWPGADFTARGALIYNVTRSNKSVAVLDFGSDKTFTVTNNTVTMPANTATTALIRFP